MKEYQAVRHVKRTSTGFSNTAQEAKPAGSYGLITALLISLLLLAGCLSRPSKNLSPADSQVTVNADSPEKESRKADASAEERDKTEARQDESPKASVRPESKTSNEKTGTAPVPKAGEPAEARELESRAPAARVFKKQSAPRKKMASRGAGTYKLSEQEVMGWLDNPSAVYILDNSGRGGSAIPMNLPRETFNTEEYHPIAENGFRDALKSPLSTFSIDVDAASYANVRRFITGNALPPQDAVRIEELINYFSYDYPQPQGDDPFAIVTEVSGCPWNNAHRLVHIGLQGKNIDVKDLPASNLVFLLDVSGSMDSPNKLGLLKKAFKLLADQLRARDRVSIIVYAGAAGQVLSPTSGNDKRAIFRALDNLQAGGSTAGGAGIQLAYKTAIDNFIPDGNNRVILATDGDFNVGTSSDGELVRLIEKKRKSGVFLTILGFGMGNYKDGKMEQLADKGNGSYAYIDNLMEAKKVLVSEIGGTLVTIAKDVKLQVEFNPARVNAYRLIGYENRVLNSEDFNDDKKDAGELGAGHTVTALYEIVPAGTAVDLPETDELKYQKPASIESAHSDELLTVKFRYKPPRDSISRLLARTLKDKENRLSQASDNFRFSAAVAGFGMLLRESQHKGTLEFKDVITMAKAAKGKDDAGYRAEFIRLAETAALLKDDGKM